jgi:hypothetical protein
MTLLALPEQGMLDWLQSEDVVTPEGEVMSWVNAGHQGYHYPEIAGYLLSLLAQEGQSSARLRNRIVQRLTHDLSPSGGVGRWGTDYVFDSAMVLSGLLAHTRVGGLLPEPTMPHRLFAFVSSHLAQYRGLSADQPADSGHWSLSYGCHLLKVARAAFAYGDAYPASRTPLLVVRLLNDMLPLAEDGRFRINGESDDTYTHAACYAVEGLLAIEGRGLARVHRTIEACADWMADVQLPDGGMPAGTVGDQPLSLAHSDASAQAVRIWACVDPTRYRGQIDRGVDFLMRVYRAGGIRYRPGSRDINTWATIFGLQALRWARTRGEWQWIV